ncbi:MAG: hypothetical protein ABIH27_03810, partial [Candidatus Omnitrophota bacterium]
LYYIFYHNLLVLSSKKCRLAVYFLLGAAKTFAAQVPQSLPEWRLFFAWCRKDFCGASTTITAGVAFIFCLVPQRLLRRKFLDQCRLAVYFLLGAAKAFAAQVPQSLPDKKLVRFFVLPRLLI